MRRSFALKALALLAVLIALPARTATSQAASAAPADTQSALESSADSIRRVKARARELDEVRVVARRTRSVGYTVTSSRTAMKTNTPLRDTPQAATVITNRIIADQSMQTMADVVRFIPGVTMAQGEGHRDAPIIRGQASTADFFVDGVRDDAQYYRDLYNVERIEALKGSNAMVFGRGGGGGVINQVRKEASMSPVGALTIEGGSFDHKRGTVDLGRPINDRIATRLNGVYEKSGGFRNAAYLERRGVSPTATIVAGEGTVVRLDYEFFRDDRIVDRGIPSFKGRPAPTPITTFFGDPDASSSRARVDAGGVVVDRELGGGLTLRNRTRAVRYDKFYQNVYPGGAVDSTGTKVSLSAYNNATERTNLFNQTDLTAAVMTGPVKHTVLAGAELSRQTTDNFRNTGYFNGNATSTSVSFAEPTRATSAVFRQSATDADNRARADVFALYAQDQVQLSPNLQAVVGIRVDEFKVRFHDNRAGQDLERSDRLVSPRAGLVFKPIAPASLYASYSVSHLPSSGDQFSSLTATTQTLEPEQFRNYEVGAKWDVHQALSLTGALFQLDRSNSSAPDPTTPSRTVQTGAQRTTGYELGVTGELLPAWQVVAGYSAQNAKIRSRTTAAAAGATVPLVPARTVSFWNRLQLAPALGAGLGAVHQSQSFAAIDNTVALPAFTRVDAALYVALPWHSRAQLNVENVFDARYFGTSHGNNNIMPGASRTVRLSLTTGF